MMKSDQVIVVLHNESIYGLTSSVWGKEKDAIYKAHQASTTMINTVAIQGIDIPITFGEVKQSGIGR